MAKHAAPPPDCPRCGGDGTITITTDGQNKQKSQTVTCSTCNGTGKA
jgi:DnaJ-class molecular chaperone